VSLDVRGSFCSDELPPDSTCVPAFCYNALMLYSVGPHDHIIPSLISSCLTSSPLVCMRHICYRLRYFRQPLITLRCKCFHTYQLLVRIFRHSQLFFPNSRYLDIDYELYGAHGSSSSTLITHPIARSSFLFARVCEALSCHDHFFTDPEECRDLLSASNSIFCLCTFSSPQATGNPLLDSTTPFIRNDPLISTFQCYHLHRTERGFGSDRV